MRDHFYGVSDVECGWMGEGVLSIWGPQGEQLKYWSKGQCFQDIKIPCEEKSGLRKDLSGGQRICIHGSTAGDCVPV